jgi:hypothetical protein
MEGMAYHDVHNGIQRNSNSKMQASDSFSGFLIYAYLNLNACLCVASMFQSKTIEKCS